MCWMAAIPIAMAGASMASSAFGQKAQAKAAAAQTDAARKQKRELIKAGNYEDQNLNLQQRESWEATNAKLSDARLTAIQNLGMVNTAISESNMEGNSMERLQRVALLDEQRQAQALMDENTSMQNQLWAARIGNTESTRGQVDAINGKAPKRSVLADALEIGTAGAQGYMAGKSLGGGSTTPAPSKTNKPSDVFAAGISGLGLKTRKGG